MGGKSMMGPQRTHQLQWQGPGTSPAAGVNLPYAQVKAFLTHRFESSIINPLQQQVDMLRAERDRLCGVLNPSDPICMEIVSEAQARFTKPGSIKLFDKRRLKMIDLRKQLAHKEQMMATLLPEIAELRVSCALYRAQVDKDNIQRGEVKADKRAMQLRWEEDAARRQKAKEDKLERDSAKVRNVKQPVQLSAYYSEEFLPAHMRSAQQPAAAAYHYAQQPAAAAYHYAQQQPRAASINSSTYAAVGHQFVDDEAMEDDEDEDDC
jgi:hypothetical protein